MIVYEVNLDIDWAVADAFRSWLARHVEQMLALPGFVSAERFDLLQPPAAADRARFCVQYRLRDAAALEHYLQHDAARMRADGASRFGDRMTATRRVMLPVAAID